VVVTVLSIWHNAILDRAARQNRVFVDFDERIVCNREAMVSWRNIAITPTTRPGTLRSVGDNACFQQLRTYAIDLVEFECGRAYDADVAERDTETVASATVRRERTLSKRVLDLCLLVALR